MVEMFVELLGRRWSITFLHFGADLGIRRWLSNSIQFYNDVAVVAVVVVADDDEVVVVLLGSRSSGRRSLLEPPPPPLGGGAVATVLAAAEEIKAARRKRCSSFVCLRRQVRRRRRTSGWPAKQNARNRTKCTLIGRFLKFFKPAFYKMLKKLIKKFDLQGVAGEGAMESVAGPPKLNVVTGKPPTSAFIGPLSLAPFWASDQDQ